ncbi:hypothetical protein Tsubulata_027349 [Turnera subulata]|uniref:F-box associated beta-propeller type 1 domain-containing protein n=1 Tax=Turnera subulata TaxID=218843 RepID=A0A9Q0G1B4_9ROSI|nr:hypothetical protein Tsubulata_027349 [Turnera subulata]
MFELGGVVPPGRHATSKFKTKANLPAGNLVGSCNGLLCLSEMGCKRSFFLCNPMTGERMKSPVGAARKWGRKDGCLVDTVSGFGFSAETNRYMVILITKRVDFHPRRRVNSKAEIYFFGSDRWKSIGDVPFPAHRQFFAVSLNGGLHWIVDMDDFEDAGLIFAFDIEKERVRSIKPPRGFTMDTSEMSLGVLWDRLFICDSLTSYNLEIWVMRQYGVRASWTKEIVIAKDSFPRALINCFVRPIMVSKEGEILLLGEHNGLVLYDPNTRCFKEVPICRVGSEFEAFCHVARFDSLLDIMAPMTCPVNSTYISCSNIIY